MAKAPRRNGPAGELPVWKVRVTLAYDVLLLSEDAETARNEALVVVDGLQPGASGQTPNVVLACRTAEPCELHARAGR